MAERLKGQIALDLRRGGDAVSLLCDSARRLQALDPDLARDTYTEALRAASAAGRLGPGMSAVATAARAVASASSSRCSSRRAMARHSITDTSVGSIRRASSNAARAWT